MENVIIKPAITEKAMKEAQKGKFTFLVKQHAKKPVIKNEVEKNFNVNVTHISTIVIKGRKTRVGQKRSYKALGSWKKAVVTLKEGQKIALFELGK